MLATILLATAAVPAGAQQQDDERRLVSPAAGAAITGTRVHLLFTSSCVAFDGPLMVDGIDRDELLDRYDPPDGSSGVLNTTSLTNGPHRFQAKMYYSCNIEDAPDLDVIWTVKNNPPAAAVAAPAPASTVFGMTPVRIEAAADPTGPQRIEAVEVRLDREPLFTDRSAPYETMLDTRQLSNGPHALTITTRDTAGLVSTTSSSFTVANQRAQVTLTAAKDRAAAGSNAVLTGRVLIAETGDPTTGTVQLQSRRGDQTGWNTIRTAQTTPNGTVQFAVPQKLTHAYRLTYPGSTQTRGAASGPVTVNAVPALKLAYPRTGRKGTVHGTVSITPARAGQPVVIQARRVGGTWTDVSSRTSDAGSTPVAARFTRNGTYEVRVHRRADRLGTVATSGPVRITIQ